jgi:hypothetical protein
MPFMASDGMDIGHHRLAIDQAAAARARSTASRQWASRRPLSVANKGKPPFGGFGAPDAPRAAVAV